MPQLHQKGRHPFRVSSFLVESMGPEGPIGFEYEDLRHEVPQRSCVCRQAQIRSITEAA